MAKTLQLLVRTHETFIRSIDSGYVVTGGTLSELTSSDDEEFEDVLEKLDVDSLDTDLPAAYF